MTISKGALATGAGIVGTGGIVGTTLIVRNSISSEESNQDPIPTTETEDSLDLKEEEEDMSIEIVGSLTTDRPKPKNTPTTFETVMNDLKTWSSQEKGCRIKIKFKEEAPQELSEINKDTEKDSLEKLYEELNDSTTNFLCISIKEDSKRFLLATQMDDGKWYLKTNQDN